MILRVSGAMHAADATKRLTQAGLRPTRQRVALARLLFAGSDRHHTAEHLHNEAARAGVPVSLATVYNTLHQFTDAGLLREVIVEPGRSYFDTNIADHHHYYVENEGRLLDIPGEAVAFERLPAPPEGMQIERLDIVIRLKRRRTADPSSDHR